MSSDLIIQAKLAEYQSLREESLAGIEHRITVVNFAFGALSVLIAGLLSSSLPELATGLIAYTAVPLVARCSLFVWLGEYKRSQRAGRRIREIEREIDVELKRDHVMQWERRLADRRDHMALPYKSTVALLYIVGWGGIAIGLALIYHYRRAAGSSIGDVLWIVAGLLTLALVFEALTSILFRREWQQVQQERR